MSNQTTVNSNSIGPKYYLLLFVIAGIGLIARLWLLDERWINPDEGAHMMDAFLVLKGMVPSVDFVSRQPLHTLSIAAAFKVLGTGYLSGRILMLLLSLSVALPIFFMARIFYNQQVALIATTLYLLLPLEILNSVVVKTEPLSMLLISLSFLMIAKFCEKEETKWLIPAGVLAALGFYVRQSALIVPMAIVLFLVLYGRVSVGDRVKRLFYVAGGYLGVILLVFLYYRQFLTFGEIWVSSLNPIFFVLDSFKSVFLSTGMSAAETAGILEVQSSSQNVQSPYALYYGYVIQALRMHLFLIAGSVLALLLGFYRVVVQRRQDFFNNRSMIIYLWITLMTLAYVYYFRARGFYIDYFREFFPPLVMLSAAWLTGAFPDLEKGNNAFRFTLVAGVVLIVLFMVILKFKNLIPTKGVSLLLLVSLAIFQLYRWKRHGFKLNEIASVLSAAVVLAILGYNLAYTAKRTHVRYDSNWPPSSVVAVSDYIAQHTDSTDTVISGAVIWELASKRMPFMNISHPLEFGFTLPKERRTALRNAIYQKPPKIIVMDGVTERTYYSQVPDLADVLQSLYDPVLTVEAENSQVAVFQRR